MSHIHTIHNQIQDNAAMSQYPLFNISYGVKSFSPAPLLPITIGNYRRDVQLWEYLYIVPLCFLAAFMGVCIGLFYAAFPAQVIWLLPTFFMLFVLR